MGYRSTNTIVVTSGPPISVGLQAPAGGTSGIGLGGTGKPSKSVAQAGAATLGLAGRTGGARLAPQAGIAALGLSGGGSIGRVDVTGAFTHVTIFRSYELATGESPSGTVYFTPSDWMLHSGVTIPPAAIPAPLDSEGQISTSLVANTDPGTVPVDSYYVVHEAIVGQPDRTYKVAVPYDEGDSIDLATLPVIP